MFTHKMFDRMNRLDFDAAMWIARRRVNLRLPDSRTDRVLRSLCDPEFIRGARAFLSNTKFRFGPVALTNAAANYLNPGTTTGGVNCTGAPFDKLYIVLTHIRVVNKTAGAVTVSLFIGATGGSAAGTEFAWSGYPVPANNWIDWYGNMRLSQADFLTGLAGANTSLTIQGEGEIGVGA